MGSHTYDYFPPNYPRIVIGGVGGGGGVPCTLAEIRKTCTLAEIPAEGGKKSGLLPPNDKFGPDPVFPPLLAHFPKGNVQF